MSNLILPDTVSTKFSFGNLLNTLNPFPAIFGKGKSYIPAPFIKIFKGGKKWNESGGPAKAAHIAATTLSAAAIFSLGALGLRSLFHSLKIDNIREAQAGSTAGLKLLKIYKRPTRSMLRYNKLLKPMLLSDSQTATNQITKKADFNFNDPYHWALGTIPPAVALIAAISTYRMADKGFDKRLGKRLDKLIAKALALRLRLASSRIKNARNVDLSDADMKLLKSASIVPLSISPALGAGAMILAALAFAGAYNYGQDNDEATARYKARKKGLLLYTKARVYLRPVLSTPIDPLLMRIFDASLNKRKNSISNVDTYKDIMI